MAYHIYDTEAFILNDWPVREANRVYDLLSADLGLVKASAQGVRLIKSKLRGQLFKYSRVKVSLVRGKESWRIVGAEKIDDYAEIFARPSAARAAVRLFDLLSRYVRGEGEQRRLFADVAAGLEYLKAGNSLREWELAVVFRSLSRLGYVKKDAAWVAIDEPLVWTDHLLERVRPIENIMAGAISEAAAASHL